MPLRMSSLNDLDKHEEYSDNGKKKQIKLAHIPNLPESDTCQRLLNRIYSEFYPIIQKRNYNVVSISEMCCCGDGLDALSKRKRRKTMSPHVHGYNQTTWKGGKKAHTIHLRLRDPSNHSVLFGYEYVAGTMAHELAHCVHGPHSAKFYKLLDELLDQHAVFMSKGIVADKQGFPMGNEQAYTLGGSSNTTNKDTRNAAWEAAQRRMQQQRFMPKGPQRLGGDGGFRTLLGAREAAGQAAEARRLQDEVWCQPCQESDIVELDSDSEQDDFDRKPAAAVDANDEDDDDDRKPAAVVAEADSDKENATNRDDQNDVKPSAAASSAPPPTSSNLVTIDLTGSDDDDEETITTATHADRSRRKRTHGEAHNEEESEWSCTQCTFKNLPGTLVCGMCGKESQLAAEKTKRVVAQIRKKDEIEQVKRAEVEQSVNEFGFNIYGNGKRTTAKLPHLT